MSEISPKWALTIYAKLWVSFGNRSFSKEESKKVVKGNRLVLAISRLKKDGWLNMRVDPNDARKNLYILKDPKEVMEEIGKGK